MREITITMGGKKETWQVEGPRLYIKGTTAYVIKTEDELQAVLTKVRQAGGTVQEVIR